MNRKPFRKIIAAAALAVAATTGASALTATDASALTGWDDTAIIYQEGNTSFADVGVNYTSRRSVDIKAVVLDRPADSYCTIVTATLYNWWGPSERDVTQLGSTVTIGSVCNGNYSGLPKKTITTQAGDIDLVKIVVGAGVQMFGEQQAVCVRGSDVLNGVPHFCR